jgi:hypothetical protein
VGGAVRLTPSFAGLSFDPPTVDVPAGQAMSLETTAVASAALPAGDVQGGVWLSAGEGCVNDLSLSSLDARLSVRLLPVRDENVQNRIE